MKEHSSFVRTLFIIGIGFVLGRESIKTVAQELELRNDELINAINRIKQNNDCEKRRLSFDRDRYKLKWNMLVNWKKINSSGRTINSFVDAKGMRSIGVYGLGEMGQLLVDEIIDNKECNTKIKYIVDKKKHGLSYRGIPILSPSNSLDKVDCIIVCTVMNRMEIQNALGNNNKLIELKDILMGDALI